MKASTWDTNWSPDVSSLTPKQRRCWWVLLRLARERLYEMQAEKPDQSAWNMEIDAELVAQAIVDEGICPSRNAAMANIRAIYNKPGQELIANYRGHGGWGYSVSVLWPELAAERARNKSAQARRQEFFERVAAMSSGALQLKAQRHDDNAATRFTLSVQMEVASEEAVLVLCDMLIADFEVKMGPELLVAPSEAPCPDCGKMLTLDPEQGVGGSTWCCGDRWKLPSEPVCHGVINHADVLVPAGVRVKRGEPI